MISQILFLFGLHCFGVFLGLIFKRQIPTIFISITGFLWGALVWVVGGVLLLVLMVPYTAASMAFLFLLLGMGIGIIHARQGTLQLSRREWIGILAVALVFILVLVLVGQFNYAAASPDSVVMISTGRRITYQGFNSGIIEELSLRGVFLPQLQSVSVFLGVDYLVSAQPAFAFTFLLTFFYLSQRAAHHLIADKRWGWVLAFLSSLVLFSTNFILFQSFYIHTNLISAVYLFVGTVTLWLAIIEEKEAWIFVGMLALLGFSLARTEAPLFGLLFLALAISADRFSYQIRLKAILPYLLMLVSWYLYLLWRMGAGTYILNPERTLIIIGTLCAMVVLVLVSEVKWIKRTLLPHLPKIMLGGLVLLVLVMALQKPTHFKSSIYISIYNLLETGEWGLTWLVFSFLFLVSITGPRLAKEELFLYGIPSFFASLLAIVYFRVPYQPGWGDSANRMVTHILPLVILYVLMKAAHGISKALPVEEKIRDYHED